MCDKICLERYIFFLKRRACSRVIVNMYIQWSLSGLGVSSEYDALHGMKTSLESSLSKLEHKGRDVVLRSHCVNLYLRT